MNIPQKFLEKNDCYRAGKKIKPQGIVVHSTGVNQKKIRVFLNSWNKAGVKTCVHAFIGMQDDGTLGIVQTLPWTMRCWGVGSGKKGSYNNAYIQFEICEDALNDRAYFDAVFTLAARLCAFLIHSYGISVSHVVSHAEAHQMGYASNHADCDHWLKKFGKTMNDFRNEVKRMTEIQQTVAHMIADGVTSEENRESWELFLMGAAPMEPDYVRAIFDRYHERQGNT